MSRCHLLQGLVREQLPRLRTKADRAALLANLICEAFGNFMGVVQVQKFASILYRIEWLHEDSTLWRPSGTMECDSCSGFSNELQLLQEGSTQPALQQLQAGFGAGPIPVGELIAAGLGGARRAPCQ